MPLSNRAILREPTVTVLARPQFSEPGHLPVQWIGEATDGERLAEYAGRLCYMSQRNPAGRDTREYLENINELISQVNFIHQFTKQESCSKMYS